MGGRLSRASGWLDTLLTSDTGGPIATRWTLTIDCAHVHLDVQVGGGRVEPWEVRWPRVTAAVVDRSRRIGPGKYAGGVVVLADLQHRRAASVSGARAPGGKRPSRWHLAWEPDDIRTGPAAARRNCHRPVGAVAAVCEQALRAAVRATSGAIQVRRHPPLDRGALLLAPLRKSAVRTRPATPQEGGSDMNKRPSREGSMRQRSNGRGEGARGACRLPRDIAGCRSPEDLHANSTRSPSSESRRPRPPGRLGPESTAGPESSPRDA
jgi:hypothetical protein